MGGGPSASRRRDIAQRAAGDSPRLQRHVRVVVELGVFHGGPEHTGSALLLMPLRGSPRRAVRCGHSLYYTCGWESETGATERAAPVKNATVTRGWNTEPAWSGTTPRWSHGVRARPMRRVVCTSRRYPRETHTSAGDEIRVTRHSSRASTLKDRGFVTSQTTIDPLERLEPPFRTGLETGPVRWSHHTVLAAALVAPRPAAARDHHQQLHPTVGVMTIHVLPASHLRAAHGGLRGLKATPRRAPGAHASDGWRRFRNARGATAMVGKKTSEGDDVVGRGDVVGYPEVMAPRRTPSTYLPGSTRSVHERDHAVITQESRVWCG